MNENLVSELVGAIENKTNGMVYPIEIIVFSANRYFVCMTKQTSGEKAQITSRSKGFGNHVVLPLEVRLFDKSGKTARIVIVGDCASCCGKEVRVNECSVAS